MDNRWLLFPTEQSLHTAVLNGIFDYLYAFVFQVFPANQPIWELPSVSDPAREKASYGKCIMGFETSAVFHTCAPRRAS
jgi:hypothetical protein